jgi:small conductance mechanosensitive channel
VSQGIDWNSLVDGAAAVTMKVGLQILAAFAFWIIGRQLIHVATSLVSRAMDRQRVEPTLTRYLVSSLVVALNVALVIAILGYFGVETTSFAALIAAAGVAIGMAWSGLLGNFAAGAFLLILRPFKVGDFIEGGGVVGTVQEIGLFVTTIDAPDNVRTFVGNTALFAGTIRNFSANPHRRVDRLAQLDASVDHEVAIRLLRDRLGKIPNVLADPPPDVEIIDATLAGPVLAVRPYCHNAHYWQVVFDTNRLIRETFGEAGFPAPATRTRIDAPAPPPAAH